MKKVGIVEDELIIAANLESALKKMGYEPLEPASNYNEALELLESGEPELYLIDINLDNKKSGIDFAEQVRQRSDCPIIFVTAYADPKTLESTVKASPDAYLLKPVSKEQLFATLKIAINKYHERIASNSEDAPKSITIKDGYRYSHVSLSSIMYVESDRNYVTYYLSSGKKTMERATLKEIDERLYQFGFIKINRSYILNTKQISEVSSNEVLIQGKKFKVNKSIREKILELMRS